MKHEVETAEKNRKRTGEIRRMERDKGNKEGRREK